MQFSAVPAGTLAPAALQLRGADPDVEHPAGSSYIAMMGATHNARNAVAAANHRATSWSATAGLVVNYMFTDSQAVLATSTVISVVDLAAIDAAFNYITQGWNNVPYSEEEFRESAEALMANLDHANMPPALMVQPAGLFAVEAPGGAMGGNQTLFRRSGTFQQAAAPVPAQPGLFRLRPLAALYRMAPGYFLTADRDMPNTPLAQILDSARRLAEAELVPGARVADPPLRTAAVALERFKTMLPDPGYELFFSSGAGNAPDRYIQAFSDGAALCVPMGLV